MKSILTSGIYIVGLFAMRWGFADRLGDHVLMSVDWDGPHVRLVKIWENLGLTLYCES